MEGQLVQRCYFRYVIQSNVACYFRYVTLRLRITVFEQVGLPYVYTFTMRVCSYTCTRIVRVVFFFFSFLLRLALNLYVLDALSYFRIPFRLS